MCLIERFNREVFASCWTGLSSFWGRGRSGHSGNLSQHITWTPTKDQDSRGQVKVQRTSSPPTSHTTATKHHTHPSPSSSQAKSHTIVLRLHRTSPSHTDFWTVAGARLVRNRHMRMRMDDGWFVGGGWVDGWCIDDTQTQPYLNTTHRHRISLYGHYVASMPSEGLRLWVCVCPVTVRFSTQLCTG